MINGSKVQSGHGRRRAGLLGFVVAAIAALPLAACGDGGNAAAPAGAAADAATAAPPTATPIPTIASAGCGTKLPSAITAGQSTARKLTSGGRERTYQLRIPATYNPAKPVALVLNFHGRTSMGIEQETYSGLVPLSDKEGFVLVSPDGIEKNWMQVAGADEAFSRDLVGRLEQELCVDSLRIFATGISMGGFMSNRLACVAGDMVAAVAPLAGVAGPLGQCGGQPVPILEFHGTADKNVPFDGTAALPGVMTAMGKWAAYNGCEAQPTEQRVSAHVKKLVYPGCKADTLHYVVEGGGHTWPGSDKVMADVLLAMLGPTTDEISAAELIWAFFKEHPKQAPTVGSQ